MGMTISKIQLNQAKRKLDHHRWSETFEVQSKLDLGSLAFGNVLSYSKRFVQREHFSWELTAHEMATSERAQSFLRIL